MFFARNEHTSTNDREPSRRGRGRDSLTPRCERTMTMKLFSANIEDFRSLYISNLKKALDMEQKITKALPDLIEKSSDATLATAFSNHLEETRGHVVRVESLLRKHIGETATETCKVINGLT